jgi:hypothetical protein
MHRRSTVLLAIAALSAAAPRLSAQFASRPVCTSSRTTIWMGGLSKSSPARCTSHLANQGTQPRCTRYRQAASGRSLRAHHTTLGPAMARSSCRSWALARPARDPLRSRQQSTAANRRAAVRAIGTMAFPDRHQLLGPLRKDEDSSVRKMARAFAHKAPLRSRRTARNPAGHLCGGVQAWASSFLA